MKCPNCNYLLKGKICFACEKVVTVEVKIPKAKKARDRKIKDLIDKPITKLVDDLDEIYSKYVRLKNADENGTVKCFTCGKFFFWLYIQNGHYKSRSCKSLRWDEMNTSPQCYHCNVTLKGNYPQYTEALIRKYGPGVINLLEVKSHNKFKMGRFELSLLIKDYSDKVNHILKSRKIPEKQF